ncbi:MAG: hypothetical protein WCT53_05615, partial [Candidatus Gracilibacteria bacterium]
MAPEEQQIRVIVCARLTPEYAELDREGKVGNVATSLSGERLLIRERMFVTREELKEILTEEERPGSIIFTSENNPADVATIDDQINKSKTERLIDYSA